MKRQVKLSLLLLMAVVLISAGIYAVFNDSTPSYRANDNSAEREAGESRESPVDENSQANPSEDSKESEEEIASDELEKVEDEKGDITFLILGSDDGGRTDTIMVCKYFEETGKVSILSIPRDSRVNIPGRGLDKINHAYVYGGVELTLKTVNELLNMNIDYYVQTDYNLLKEIVDTLGGVEVNVPEGIYGLESGMQTLSGEEALIFLRHRAGYSNQDIGRIGAQQEFLKSVLKKMAETRNIFKISSMAKSGMENINTNIPITTVMSYTLKLRDLNGERIQSETLSGTPSMINGISYIIVDEPQIPDTVERLFTNSGI